MDDMNGFTGWLVGLAGHRSMDDPVIHATLRTKLAANPKSILMPKAETADMTDIAFDLTVTGSHGHRKLEIERR
jgi:hypothetical protein